MYTYTVWLNTSGVGENGYEAQKHIDSDRDMVAGFDSRCKVGVGFRAG
jgi:hypothetical protein